MVWTNEKQTGGYAEFTTSGTLTWLPEPPPEVDLFCVGGGGAGGVGAYYGGAGGGGGGYTTTVTGAELGASTEVTIGAGGAVKTASMDYGQTGNPGGTTSIGSLCAANGGAGGAGAGRQSSYANGGAGGSGGGSSTANGGSNGANGNGGNYGTGGAGQGTPTTDLIGRRHAGGGGGAGSTSGGASDFAQGSGVPSSAAGGGGYGGGGGGYNPQAWERPGTAGGQGFAMIGWGTYREDLGLD